MFRRRNWCETSSLESKKGLDRLQDTMSSSEPFDHLFKVSIAAVADPLCLLCELSLCMQILLVGDSGVGKSSLLMRFTADQFEESSVPTIGRACT